MSLAEGVSLNVMQMLAHHEFNEGQTQTQDEAKASISQSECVRSLLPPLHDQSFSEVPVDEKSLRVFQPLIDQLQKNLINASRDGAFLKNYVEFQKASLLKHALESCDYYQHFLENLDVNTASIDDWTLVDWEQFYQTLPVLRKQDLQENKDQLFSNRFADTPIHHWVTSGSTGEPTQFIVDAYSALTREISFWLAQQLMGNQDMNPQPEDTVLLRLASGEGTNGWFKKMPVYNNASLWKRCVFDSPDFNMKEVFDFLREKQPLLLSGDPQAFIMVIDAWNNTYPEETYYPYPVINITCGGTQLSDSDRARIEAFFKAPVMNCYALSEVGIVASECTSGNLHVHSPVNDVEIVDEVGNRLPDGELGEITITNLLNWSFPFVRYQSGDMARLDTTTRCECGSQFPVLYDFQGKRRRLFSKPDGSKYSPCAMVEQFIRLRLRQYQLIQYAPTKFMLRYRREDQLSKIEIKRLKTKLSLLTGAVIQLDVQQCERIQQYGKKFHDFISHCDE